MNGKLQAEKRETTTRGELRKVRMAGKVPGVIYGKDVESPTSISVDAKRLQALLRSNPHAILEMEIEGLVTQPVMITDVQRDTLSRELLHIDFHKINMNESVKAPVRIEVTGTSAAEKEGGMMQLILHEVEVECLPNQLPEMIAVDVAQMQVGDNLTVGDLRMPEGVRATLDPDTVVLAVLAPQKDVTADEADAMDDASEEAANQAKTGETVDK
ncbi:MAG: ribosomal protein [Cohnella sp.]|jgi:large subunit ribosomal protein L25|nr:ribosomal protein [Cohnella sp.]